MVARWPPEKERRFFELYNKHKHEPTYGVIIAKEMRITRVALKSKMDSLRKERLLPAFRAVQKNVDIEDRSKPYRYANCTIIESDGIGIGQRTYDMGNRESVYLLPVGDTHSDDVGYKMLAKFLDWTREHNAYAIFMGDYGDISLKGHRYFSYDAKKPKEERDRAKKLIYNNRNIIAGAICGAHDLRIFQAVGLDYIEDECRNSGICYCSDALYLRFRFSNGIIYRFYIIHGTRGGRFLSSKLKAALDLEGIIQAPMDGYIVAHSHGKVAGALDGCKEGKKGLLTRHTTYYIVSGSFMSYKGYPVRGGFRPASIGCPRIRLDGKRHDLHVSI